jgi:hypothetical protein
MKTKLFLSIGVGALLATAPAIADHAFAAEHDAPKPVNIAGTLTKLEWSNPHAWLDVDVKDNQGKGGELGYRVRRPQRSPVSR